MHFSDRIKAEILAKPPKEQHCKKALIAGLIRGSGVLYENDGVLGLEFKAFDEETAFMLTSAFKAIFDYDIREITVEQDVHTKKDKFYLSVSGEKAFDILTQLNVLKEDDGELDEVPKTGEESSYGIIVIAALVVLAGAAFAVSKRRATR